jgi:hypothetical protein
LTVRFPSKYDLEKFKAAEGAPDVLRNAIFEEFGVNVKFKPYLEAVAEVAAPETKVIDVVEVVAEPEVVVEIEPEVEPEVAEPVDDGRYGESLLREILDAKPLDDK